MVPLMSKIYHIKAQETLIQINNYYMINLNSCTAKVIVTKENHYISIMIF